MTKTKKQQDNNNPGTKKRIIEVARRLFSQHGYLGVSMSDIAERVNITKAALYYHFAGKTEIYRQVLDEVFNRLNSLIVKALDEKTVSERLHKLVESYLDFGLAEKNLIKALALKLSPVDHEIHNHITRLRQRVSNAIRSLVEEMFVGKQSARKVDSRSLTSMLIAMMDGVILQHSLLNNKIDTKKASKQIAAALGLDVKG